MSTQVLVGEGKTVLFPDHMTEDEIVKHLDESMYVPQLPEPVEEEEPEEPEVLEDIGNTLSEDVGSIRPAIESKSEDAWRNVYNTVSDLGLSRAASQKLADMAQFFYDMTPAGDADVLSTGTQKLSEGDISGGAIDIASGTLPVLGDVGKAIFAGVRSVKGSSPDLTRAITESMSTNKTPEDIYKDTGWYKGAEDKWKREIDDSNAVLTIDRKPNRFNEKLMMMDIPYEGIPLGDVLDHPELFKAYPELKGITVKPTPGFSINLKGAFDATTDTLYLNSTLKDGEALSTALHEIQHSVQKIEGFLPGGGPEQFLPDGVKEATAKVNKKLKDLEEKVDGKVNSFIVNSAVKYLNEGGHLFDYHKEALKQLEDAGIYDEYIEAVTEKNFLSDLERNAFKTYESLAGEVEARNVQTRRGMSMEDRRASIPESTEDIPRVQRVLDSRKPEERAADKISLEEYIKNSETKDDVPVQTLQD